MIYVLDASRDLAERDGLVEVSIATHPLVLGLVEELTAARGGLSDAITMRRRIVVSSSPSDANASLPEPLTERELQILGHLVGHSTSAELATQFFVSISTVKTHTSRIYRKLGVSGRSGDHQGARARTARIRPVDGPGSRLTT